MTERKALVTGGAGFIGSHLAAALVKRGYDVRVADNFSAGREENLARLAGQIEFIRGDLVDANIARRAVDGVTVVFHQAALASVPRSVANPLQTHASCATATLN